MRLGINGWRLCHERTGVARYLQNVLAHWPARSSTRFSTVTLYTPKPIDRAYMALPGGIAERVLPSDSPMLVWENTRLAAACTDDVLFCPSFSRPVVCRSRTVVATHDMVYHVRPEMFPLSVRLFYRRLYDWSDRHAALVITDGEAVKREIVEYCRVPSSRVRVTYLAPAGCFRAMRGSDATTAAHRFLGSDRPFMLFVGKVTGRRSLPALLEAFAHFRRTTGLPHRLALVGLNPRRVDLRRQATTLGIDDAINWCGFVKDDDLNHLYNAAESFVMPSVYETTSLPVMEAQATGLPVICIDTPGMQEITGGAACLIPSLEPVLLAEAMATLARDGGLREDLSRRGLQNAARFSWSRCATETVAVLEEAAGVPA